MTYVAPNGPVPNWPWLNDGTRNPLLLAGQDGSLRPVHCGGGSGRGGFDGRQVWRRIAVQHALRRAPCAATYRQAATGSIAL